MAPFGKIMCMMPALILLLMPAGRISAQDVPLINPSFEDIPHFGKIENGTRTHIRDWYDCAVINKFFDETPPDIHGSADTSFWENNLSSAHGNTYLGLVVRDNETWESVTQRLALPLKKGKCYTFSIFLARSDNYWSRAKVANQSIHNFIQPAVFQLWGGTGPCGDKELLASSEPVDNSEWMKNTFFIEPQSDIYFITLQAFYKTPVLFPYNGHILLDGASGFELTECAVGEAAVYKREKLERNPTISTMPAHKARARKTEVYNREKKKNKIDTVVYTRPQKEKILADLDREKVRKGQSIKIDRLYFEADTTSIGVESFEVLNEVYEFLNDNPDIVVEIGGHTNGIPRHTYCDQLSTQRAKAVANYLISKGIDEERVQYKGYGKRKPIASNSTPEGRKRNQRVEIKIISMDS